MNDTTSTASGNIYDLFNGALNGYFATEQSRIAAQASSHESPYGSYSATNGTLTDNKTQATQASGASALTLTPIMLIGAGLVALVVLFKVLK